MYPPKETVTTALLTLEKLEGDIVLVLPVPLKVTVVGDTLHVTVPLKFLGVAVKVIFELSFTELSASNGTTYLSAYKSNV